MGTYKNKSYPLRIDENVINKVKEIAEIEGRSANKQIEHILKKYIEEYEAQHQRAERKQSLEKSSTSRTG